MSFKDTFRSFTVFLVISYSWRNIFVLAKSETTTMEQKGNHVCPWWLGYTFIFPIRMYQHNPEKILGSHIKEGMTVMDYGCAMGCPNDRNRR